EPSSWAASTPCTSCTSTRPRCVPSAGCWPDALAGPRPGATRRPSPPVRWRWMRDLRRLRTLGGVVCLLVYAGASMLLVLRAAQVRGLEARACLELVGLLTTGLHTTSAGGD